MEQFIQKYPYNQLFENNADSHFYMKIGGTVYDVTTHYDPKGRQCVLEQFKELLLQRNGGNRTIEKDSRNQYNGIYPIA